MINKLSGIKQVGSIVTFLAASIIHDAAKSASAQEKTNNTPALVLQAPKGYITTVNKPDGTKIIEERDATNFLFKRTTKKLLEKGNVTETVVEDFDKATGNSFKVVTREQKDGLKRGEQFFSNGLIYYASSVELYKSEKIKERLTEAYDQTNGSLRFKRVIKYSEDGKKSEYEVTDGFGLLKEKRSITILNNDSSDIEIKYYARGVFTGKAVINERNVSKFISLPPDGKPKVQQKVEILIATITKDYDVNEEYEGKVVLKLSTDNLIAIYESYDKKDKMFERETKILEYQKDKISDKYIKYFANMTIEKLNENGVCVNKNETQYRADGSQKITDETFSNAGKLQIRITQEEIRARRVVETRIEEFDKQGKKTKDEKSVMPIE